MKKATCFLVILTAWLAASQYSFGEQPARGRLAATSQLPPALLALEPSADQIVTEQEAEDVRGQWVINFDFPLLATQIEGWGRFEMAFLTLTGPESKKPGSPVFVRLTIGR
jgi:hypothetical protein